MTAPFQLPISDGPTVRDAVGNVWRYLHYPPESRAARLVNDNRHEGGICLWYLDSPEQLARYVINCSHGMPCIHRGVEVTGEGVIQDGQTWYLSEAAWHKIVSQHQSVVCEIPFAMSAYSVPKTRFHFREMIAPLEKLGHEPVKLTRMTAEMERTAELGRRISQLWTDLHQSERDERRMLHPNRSSSYRERQERIRLSRLRLEEEGYPLAQIEAGAEKDRNHEFGNPYASGVVLGENAINYTRCWQIGRWAEKLRQEGGEDTGTVNQKAVAELLDW